MFLESKNHKNLDSILGTARLVFENKPEQAAEDVLAQEPRPQDLEKKIKDASEKLSANGAEIYALVEAYNKMYASSPWFRKRPEIYEEKLVLSLEDTSKSKIEIDRILKTPYRFENNNYELGKIAPSDKRSGQADILKKIKKLFDNRDQLITIETKARDEKLNGHMRGLVYRSREVEQITQTDLEWRKRPEFGRLDNAYKNVIGKFISDPRYAHFYKDGEGKFNPAFERQNKQLFFAILARETNGFTNESVFGDRFSDDPEENKKNFPFLYNEFLTRIHNFNPEEIIGAENDVKRKEEEMKAKGIPVGSDLVNEMNSYMGQNSEAVAKTGKFGNPFEKLDEPKEEKDESLKIQLPQLQIF